MAITATDEAIRRAQFWKQGAADFNKGKDPRWSTSHAFYIPYIQGYEFARKQAKVVDKQERKDNSWWTALKKKVKAWIGK